MAHPDIRPKPNNLDVGRSIEEQLAGVRDQVEAPADKPALGEEETGDVPAPAVVAESAPKPLEPVKEPALGLAPAEKQKPPEPVRNLDQELGAEIARVGEKIKVLADGSNERIKGQLEAQWKLLEHYKKFSRNPNQTLIDRVQAALEKIRRIEAKAEPRPARVSRTGRGPGPALAKRAAPVGPEPTANPEASAEARESMIKERAAQIRAKREAGGAEANVEVDARITAAGAFSFTPEADAIAAQWDREQAAKQITEEEAQARQAHQEALAQAPTPAPAPAAVEIKESGADAENEIAVNLEIILRKLEDRVGEKPPYIIQAKKLLPGWGKSTITSQLLAEAKPILERLEQLADGGWPEEDKSEDKKAKRLRWEREVAAKFIQLDRLLRFGPAPATTPVESGAAIPVPEVQPLLGAPEVVIAGGTTDEGASAVPQAGAKRDINRERVDSRKENEEAKRLREERAQQLQEDRRVLLEHFGDDFDFQDADVLRAKARELGVEVDERDNFMTLPGKIRQALEAKAPSQPEQPAASEPVQEEKDQEAEQPAEGLDPLVADMLKMTAEEEEIIEASQAVTASYNQAVGDKSLKSAFRQQYQPVRFGAQNAAARLRDASVPPDFKTLTDGDFWAVPVEGQKNKFVVFPSLGIAIDQAIVYIGAMVEFYDMPGFDADQIYHNVQVVKPAVFELDEAAQQWKCVAKGELNLTPSPKAAEREETPPAAPEPVKPLSPAPAEEARGADPVIDLERVKEEKRKEVKGQIAQLLHKTAGAMADGDQKKIRALYEQYKLLKKELEE